MLANMLDEKHITNKNSFSELTITGKVLKKTPPEIDCGNMAFVSLMTSSFVRFQF